MKDYYVYILTNKTNSTLYTGVTSDLRKRVYQHKHKLIDGFTKKYNVNKLVYFEQYNLVENALKREKQIKAGSRKKKLELIQSKNPKFKEINVF
jgi:putative endonuclease